MNNDPLSRCAPELPTRASLLAGIRGDGSKDATAWEQSWVEFDLLYRPVLQRYARSRGVPDRELDDLCQDILIAVRRAIDTFEYDRSRCRFQTWLFTVARNHIVSHLRRGGPVSTETEAPATVIAQIADPSPCPDQLWQSEFDKSLVRLAWEIIRKSANPEYVRLYRKHVIEGASVTETVEYFRDPAVTPNRIYMAKHRVTELLAETIQSLRRNPLFL